MKKLLLTACLMTLLPQSAMSAAMATADNAGGYSGIVLQKLAETWTPPVSSKPQSTQMRIEIDDQGKLFACTNINEDLLTPMDDAVCQAARRIGTFPKPPYGLPIVLYMTVWSGNSASPASSVYSQPAPVQPVQQAAPAPVATPAPAMEKPAPQAAEKTQPVKMELASDASATGSESDYEKRCLSQIRANLIVPSSLPSGKYRSVAVIRVDASGKVVSSRLERSTGTAALDEALLKAIHENETLPAPTRHEMQDLHLTFVIQK